MLKKTAFLFMFAIILIVTVHQISTGADTPINPDLLTRTWPARWVTYPGGPFRDYGVFHFRKQFTIDTVPASFLVHVSADNRYQLFVNGIKISLGPSRSDLNHWRYETVDLAPHLKSGNNVLAAVVWNFGVYSAHWQHSFRTGFLLQGNGPAEEIVSTGNGWKCFRNDAYKPIPIPRDALPTFCVVGPGEDIDASVYPWGWEQPGYDDSGWSPGLTIGPSQPMELFQWNQKPWMLEQRDIPPMEETPERLTKIVRQTGAAATDAFLAGNAPFTIPANTSATILFDLGYLTTAYPEITVDGGAGSEIKVTYAEALFENGVFGGDRKGNRNETKGKEILGYYDIFRPDGARRMFRTLYWRTYRYLQFDITTAGSPLVVSDLRGIFTAYPFEQEATFESPDPELTEIWDIGWWTFRLCANETYFDCPYYEQLNYTGDDRVEMLVNLTNTRDDRLVKSSLKMFYYSLQPEGLMQDRYPSYEPQYIPTYSLDWIRLLHELWMYRGEEEFIEPLVPACRPILEWFERRLGNDGVLRNVSWSDPGYEGPMPANWNRPNSRLTIEFILALRDAAQLEDAFGRQYYAGYYSKLADQLQQDAYLAFWVPETGLLSETQEHVQYSQQVNVLGILADVIPEENQTAVLRRTFDGSMPLIRERQSQSSLYWLHYFHKALAKTGLGDEYLPMLDPWREMIDLGLTTWAEQHPNPRSDCHAWSSSPNINLLTIVCGIQPLIPGFRQVRIEPHLGNLEWVKGTMPHPQGTITADMKRTRGGGIEAAVILPEGITGWFIWNGKRVLLQGGEQVVKL